MAVSAMDSITSIPGTVVGTTTSTVVGGTGTVLVESVRAPVPAQISVDDLVGDRTRFALEERSRPLPFDWQPVCPVDGEGRPIPTSQVGLRGEEDGSRPLTFLDVQRTLTWLFPAFPTTLSSTVPPSSVAVSTSSGARPPLAPEEDRTPQHPQAPSDGSGQKRKQSPRHTSPKDARRSKGSSRPR